MTYRVGGAIKDIAWDSQSARLAITFDNTVKATPLPPSDSEQTTNANSTTNNDDNNNNNNPTNQDNSNISTNKTPETNLVALYSSFLSPHLSFKPIGFIRGPEVEGQDNLPEIISFANDFPLGSLLSVVCS